MSEYEKLIIDLEELPDYKFIQFLRVEILNVFGHGPSFFGRVRYARNGDEKEEGLPMDLSKGIFIATLRDDQLQGINRDELERTLQEAAIEITKIVRKNPNMAKFLSYYNSPTYNEDHSAKKSDDTSVSILKKILKDYSYLKYDKRSSEPPDVLRCDVIDPESPRQTEDIFEIARRLSVATSKNYQVGSYGGSYFNDNDNFDEVWTQFSLVNFDLLKAGSKQP